jgi:hypothetical protein
VVDSRRLWARTPALSGLPKAALAITRILESDFFATIDESIRAENELAVDLRRLFLSEG